MVAHAVAFGGEEDGVAVHGPAGSAAGISAVGQVDDGLFAVGTYYTDVGIRLMFVSDKFEGEPFSVGRPLVIESSRERVPRGAVGHLAHLLAIKVYYHQTGACFDECHFFPVGRELRVAPFHGFRRQERFFFDESRIREVGVCLAGDAGKIEVSDAVPFAAIYQ